MGHLFFVFLVFLSFLFIFFKWLFFNNFKGILERKYCKSVGGINKNMVVDQGTKVYFLQQLIYGNNINVIKGETAPQRNPPIKKGDRSVKVQDYSDPTPGVLGLRVAKPT